MVTAVVFVTPSSKRDSSIHPYLGFCRHLPIHIAPLLPHLAPLPSLLPPSFLHPTQTLYYNVSGTGGAAMFYEWVD